MKGGQPHDPNHALLPVIGGVGLLFIALSIPLIQERVPPNSTYGFRTAKSLSDSKIWYAINRISRARFAYSRYAHQFGSCCNSVPGTGSTTSSSSSNSLSADVLLTFRCCVTWVSCAEENVGLQLKLTSTALRNYGSC